MKMLTQDVETGGHCFFCWCTCKVTPPATTPTTLSVSSTTTTTARRRQRRSCSTSVYSLRCLFRYLGMNASKLFNQKRDWASVPVERSMMRITVPLCGGCSSLGKEFSRLYQQLELLEMKVHSCLKMIQGKLDVVVGVGGNDMAGLTSKSPKSVRSRHDMKMGEALRNETKVKCFQKLSNPLPLVCVPRMTTGQPEPQQKETNVTVKLEVTPPSENLVLENDLNDCSAGTEELDYNGKTYKPAVNDDESELDGRPLENDDYSTDESETEWEKRKIKRKPPKIIGTQIKAKKKITKKTPILRPGSGSGKIRTRPWSRDPETGHFNCTLCSQQFPNYAQFYLHHNVVHLQIKHKCGFCSATFHAKPVYERHIRNVHMGLTFMCDKCSTTFTDKNNLRQHQLKVNCRGPGYVARRKRKRGTEEPTIQESGRDPSSVEEVEVELALQDVNIEKPLDLHEAPEVRSADFDQSHSPPTSFISSSVDHIDEDDKSSEITDDDDGGNIKLEVKEEEPPQIHNEPEVDESQQQLTSNTDEEASSSYAAVVDDDDGDYDPSSHDIKMEDDDDDLLEKQAETVVVAPMTGQQSIKATNQAHPPVIPKGHVKSQQKKTILGMEHLQLNPVTFRVQCQLCSSEFNDKYGFQHHYRIQHLKHRFVCTLCGKVFRRKLNLTGHFDNVHKEGSFPCDKCGELFNFKNRLFQHQRASANCRRRPPEEEGEKPTSSYSYAYGPSEPCTICGRVFSRKGNLKVHLKRMHPDPGSTPPPRRKKHHVCDQCGKGFGTVYVLRGHLKKVHDMDMETTTVVVEGMQSPITPVELLEGPITALVPGEEQGSFKLTGAETETELDPELAMEAELVQLADHQGSDPVGKYSYEEVYPSGDPPDLPLSVYDPDTRKYQCPSCPMTFLANINFQNHYKAVHLRVKFRCTLCSKQFSQVASCYRHHRHIHQGLRVKCQVCHGLFTEKTALRKHLRRTPCGKGKPPKPKRLYNTIICHVCGKGVKDRYRLDSHVRHVHSDVRDRLCDICGKGFKTDQGVRMHLQRVHPETCPIKEDVDGEDEGREPSSLAEAVKDT